jgi:hypothetical protein
MSPLSFETFFNNPMMRPRTARFLFGVASVGTLHADPALKIGAAQVAALVSPTLPPIARESFYMT